MKKTNKYRFIKVYVYLSFIFLTAFTHAGGCGMGCLMVASTPATPFIKLQEKTEERAYQKKQHAERNEAVNKLADKNGDGIIDRAELEELLVNAGYTKEYIGSIPPAKRYEIDTSTMKLKKDKRKKDELFIFRADYSRFIQLINQKNGR